MAVKLITDIPGPNSIALLERREKSVAKGHGSVCDIFIQKAESALLTDCLLYTSPSPRDRTRSRMPSSA